jgi:hypothetical protein
MSKTKTQQRKTLAKHKKVARTEQWKLDTFGKKRRHIIHPRKMKKVIDEAAKAANPAGKTETKKQKGFFGRMVGKLFGRGK